MNITKIEHRFTEKKKSLSRNFTPGELHDGDLETCSEAWTHAVQSRAKEVSGYVTANNQSLAYYAS